MMAQKTVVQHCILTSFVVFCFCLLPHTVLTAQHTADTIADKVHRLESVTVTAHRQRQRTSSLAPVQNIGRTDIERLGLQSVSDAVRRFAGVNVKDYGGLGGLKTVSIRNLGAAHTAVSYDGVTVSNCQAGQIDIGRFSLDNVQLLSLSIGQTDNLLQSARHYASAGVLSIESERPTFEGDKKSAFRLQAKGGSYGFITPSLRWCQQLGKRTSMAITGNYMRADGNYPFQLRNGKQVTTEQRVNSDICSYQAEASVYHTFRDESQLQGKVHYFHSERGLPGAVILYNPAAHERLADENAFAQLRYTKHFNQQWSIQTQAKYNYGSNRYRDEGKQYADGEYSESNRQSEYYLSATALYRPLQPVSLSLAHDVAVNTLRNDLSDCPQPTRTTYITVLNARFTQSWFTANASLLHTATHEEVQKGTPRDRFNRFAPTLGTSFKLLPNDDLYLRLMYKGTFRLPTFNDLYYYQLGNQNLRPEKANEYNVGITWSHQTRSALDYLSLTIDGYYNDVTDKIVAIPTTYAWKMYNYGKVHSAGLDVALSVQLSLTDHYRMALSGSYSWQKTIDLTHADAKNYRHQVPYTPQHSGNVSAQFALPWLNVGYTMIAAGKRYFLPQNLPENEIEKYFEHSLTLSREFAFKHCKLMLQTECVNLTDAQYDVIKYYPMPGRQWRGGVTFSF